MKKLRIALALVHKSKRVDEQAQYGQ